MLIRFRQILAALLAVLVVAVGRLLGLLMPELPGLEPLGLI